WLAIVSDLVGLMAPGSSRSFAFKGADGEQRLAALEVAIGELARQLAEPQSSDLAVAASEHWPFDFTEADRLHDQLQRFSWNDAVLGLLDEYLGYSISCISAERWAFDPSSRMFTDGRGEQVPLVGWQIQTLGEGKAWSRLRQGKYLASWTETRNSEDRLLGVSVLL